MSEKFKQYLAHYSAIEQREQANLIERMRPIGELIRELNSADDIKYFVFITEASHSHKYWYPRIGYSLDKRKYYTRTEDRERFHWTYRGAVRRFLKCLAKVMV